MGKCDKIIGKYGKKWAKRKKSNKQQIQVLNSNKIVSDHFTRS